MHNYYQMSANEFVIKMQSQQDPCLVLLPTITSHLFIFEHWFQYLFGKIFPECKWDNIGIIKIEKFCILTDNMAFNDVFIAVPL